MRKILATSLATLMAFALTACSSASKSAKATNNPSQSSQSQKSTEKPEIVYTDKGMPGLKGEGADTLLDFSGADKKAPEKLTVKSVEKGSGAVVGENASVKVNYVGQVWGKDKAFDSSFKRGQSISFPLSQVIPGWTYSLEKAHVGDKIIVSVPAALGYGPQGGNAQAGIGKDDVIVFYVEVLGAWNPSSAGQKDATVEISPENLPVSYEGAVGEPVTKLKVKDGQEKPGEIQVKVIARGHGNPLPEQGTYVLQFAATAWDNDPDYIENTWQPTKKEVPSGAREFPSSQELFKKLAGIPEGSRVLITAPSPDPSKPDKAIAVVADILCFY